MTTPEPQDVGVLLSTCPPGEADGLAAFLVERRLAACVNVLGGVRSVYRWQENIERDDEAQADLAAGRRVLREVQEDHPNPKYAPRVAYLLGQFAQEMKEWDEAIASYQDRADYIAVGAMFSTSSKVNTRPAGLATLKAVREIIPADGPPLIAIGGIDKLNVAEVAKAGADGIAVIGAVAMAEDPARAASELLNAFLSAKAGS